MHVTFFPEIITNILGWPISNAVLMSWLVLAVLLTFTYFATRKIKEVPTGIQNFAEMVIEGMVNFMTTVTGDKEKTRHFFPLVATFFIFIIISNWMGILPGIGSIGIKEVEEVEAETHIESTESSLILEDHGITVEQGEVVEEVGHEEATEEVGSFDDAQDKQEEVHESHTVLMPIFRSVNSDLNMALGLGIISVIATQIFGITTLGFFKYGSKFISFKDPISFFVGILELVAEVAKIVSFSFRLFGNIFAGEVLLITIFFLCPLFAPLPFLCLEIFVGFIQALVFAMLTLVFLTIATSKSH